MKDRKRVVVTGMGVVSCFGTDVDQFYDSLLEGKSGIGPIEAFDCSEYPTRFAGSVQNFDTENYVDKKQARRIDPFISYSMVGGKKALEHAGFSLEDLSAIDKKKAGILIGSGMGGMKSFSDGVVTLQEKGFRRLSPFFVPYIITNMGGALLAIDVGFEGPNYSISTACATSSYCIYQAAEHIRRGDADIMLCGGSEASITPIGLAGFVACKALSTRNEDPQKASRPWDKDRDGFVMGEGCGVIVLESLEHALKRKAPIYAEYLGGATNCDANHITDPKEGGVGIAQCMELALQDAGVSRDRVNYLNAHATSTLAGDLAEVAAVKKVFDLSKLKMNATKSMIGHCLGAAGVLESIATIMGIHRKRLHPTINVENPEPELEGIDIIRDKALDFEVDVALSNSYGFGGHNASLVFAPYKK